MSEHIIEIQSNYYNIKQLYQDSYDTRMIFEFIDLNNHSLYEIVSKNIYRKIKPNNIEKISVYNFNSGYIYYIPEDIYRIDYYVINCLSLLNKKHNCLSYSYEPAFNVKITIEYLTDDEKIIKNIIE